MADPITDDDYRALAEFRRQLRTFLSFSEQAASAAGITPQQHQALLALRGAPGMTLSVGALADHLRLRPHSATGLVDRLEKLDLICRTSGDDRRKMMIGLSPAGMEKIRDLTTAHRAELRRLRPLLMDMLSAL
ncbi:MarR family transcriptional regulator [Sphingomonadaceae bacterium jetA1]|uniref:MarR family winged helix-turn-helix transcriptional regulator n=1 Tax=Facivitalis istanbulensis TaxID=3075838 RepID=UPI003485A069